MAMSFRKWAIAAVLLVPVSASAQNIDLASGGADLIWRGTEPNAASGTTLDQGAVSSGDSRRDLIAGAPGGPGVLGRVFVIYGGPVRTGEISLAAADAVITGAVAGDRFGFSTAAGNVWNVEGSIPRALLVGAPNAGTGGKVYLFKGGFGSAAALNTTNALLEIQGQPGDQLGSALATADINNDGYRDIVIGAPANNRVYIIYGSAALNHTGAPTLRNLATQPADITITGVTVGATLSAADLTGDSIYDVVIGAPTANTVHVIKGRTGSTFPATWNLATTPADITFYGPTTGDRAGTSLRVADIDADGKLDVIVGAPGGDGPSESRTNAGEVYVLFGPTMAALSAASPASRSLAAADLTFYGAAADDQLGAGMTSGDITRDAPDDLVFIAPGSGSAAEALVYYGRSRGSMGTLNADGTRTVDFLSASQVDRRIIGDPAEGPIVTAQVFEVTGEGARDIVIGVPAADNGAGALYFTISPKMRLSDQTVSVSLIVNAGQSSATMIRVQNSSTIPIMWSASGNRPWLSASPTSGSAVVGQDGTFYIVASANGLAAGTYTGTMTVSSTSRDLQMALPIAVTITVAPASREPGDFSGDGSFDLVWQHQTQGWISLWRMVGVTLQGGVSMSPDRVLDTNWRIVGTGDFNGDGHPDLLWQHQTQGWISAWLMNGVNQVSGVSLIPDRVMDTNWKIVATGDFNADGKRDIVWHNVATGQASVWLMDGTRLMDGRLLTPDRVADTNWRIVGAGDFNGDRKTDLVWHNQATGDISVWYMNGTTLIDGVWVTPSRVADTNWKIRAIGDANGDGKPDLIWQHATSGKLSAWIMNGVTMVNGVLLSPDTVADTNWRIVGPR
jgi:hypothetical protein